MANRPRNEKPMVAINMHFPKDVIDEAEIEARSRGISRAQVLREWVINGKKGTSPAR